MPPAITEIKKLIEFYERIQISSVTRNAAIVALRSAIEAIKEVEEK